MENNINNFELLSSDFEEDRYSRLRLIPWWDQERLKNATIMVVGAGAIGNELIKNLALLGICLLYTSKVRMFYPIFVLDTPGSQRLSWREVIKRLAATSSIGI